jgi:hypothetical protein
MGDVIDNRRPGVVVGDDGYGVCAYTDSVELVMSTVARLCEESPVGCVVWLLGNHDLWPFINSTECRSYAPLHQCNAEGSYDLQFKRFLYSCLERARAQALLLANGVVCCHGGMCRSFIRNLEAHTDLCARVANAHTKQGVQRAILNVANTVFLELLTSIGTTPSLNVDARRFGWCFAPSSPLWCRPQFNPTEFDRLFDPSEYPEKCSRIAPALADWSYAVAHTMQANGVALAKSCTLCAAQPQTISKPIALLPQELIYMDTGMSRGFGKDNRVIQFAVVNSRRQLSVSGNLAEQPVGSS